MFENLCVGVKDGSDRGVRSMDDNEPPPLCSCYDCCDDDEPSMLCRRCDDDEPSLSCHELLGESDVHQEGSHSGENLDSVNNNDGGISGCYDSIEGISEGDSDDDEDEDDDAVDPVGNETLIDAILLGRMSKSGDIHDLVGQKFPQRFHNSS